MTEDGRRKTEDKDLEPQRHKGHKENPIKKGIQRTETQKTESRKHEIQKARNVLKKFRVFVMEVFNSTLNVRCSFLNQGMEDRRFETDKSDNF